MISSTKRSGITLAPKDLSIAGPSTIFHSLQRPFHQTGRVESGHNKWSKIRHRKAANDSQRGNIYGTLSREMIACIRSHPSKSIDPSTNGRLGGLLRRARELDVPKDKIEATLQKAQMMGTGVGSTVTYEALGPSMTGGSPVALVVECLTDSPSRTHAKVKETFNKHNARLSSTSHLFQRQGIVRMSLPKGISFNEVWDAAVEEGAEDVREFDFDGQELEFGGEQGEIQQGVEVSSTTYIP